MVDGLLLSDMALYLFEWCGVTSRRRLFSCNRNS